MSGIILRTDQDRERPNFTQGLNYDAAIDLGLYGLGDSGRPRPAALMAFVPPRRRGRQRSSRATPLAALRAAQPARDIYEPRVPAGKIRQRFR